MGRTTFITTVALAAALTVPVAAGAKPYQDLRSPDARDATTMPPPSSIAQPAASSYQDLRSPDAREAAAVSEQVAYQDLRSPDARDAGREPTSTPVPEPVVEIREAPSGFDWGSAGVGAAGILAMVSIAGGLVLLTSGRRRRRGVQPAH